MIYLDNKKLCLSAAEVSELTGVSLSLIRKLTRGGEIPHVRVGRRILYPLTGIEDWLNSRTEGIIHPEKEEMPDG